MKELTGPNVKLKINDFGVDKEMNLMIRNYHGLAVDYFGKMGVRDYIHYQHGHRRIR